MTQAAAVNTDEDAGRALDCVVLRLAEQCAHLADLAINLQDAMAAARVEVSSPPAGDTAAPAGGTGRPDPAGPAPTSPAPPPDGAAAPGPHDAATARRGGNTAAAAGAVPLRAPERAPEPAAEPAPGPTLLAASACPPGTPDQARPGVSAQTIRALQGIDRLAQTLDDLSVFLQDLADEVPQDAMVPIDQLTRRLRLRDLAATLARPERGIPPIQVPASGDVCLF